MFTLLAIGIKFHYNLSPPSEPAKIEEVASGFVIYNILLSLLKSY